jgi:hypothetical protein
MIEAGPYGRAFRVPLQGIFLAFYRRKAHY